MEKARKFIRVGVVLLAVVGCVFLAVKFLPYMNGIISEQSARDEFRDFLQADGMEGWFIFLAVHVGQMVLLLPGEPVEVLAGMAFGAVGGTALCLTGAIIGTALIYFCVRSLSALFITDKMREGIKKYRFLQSERRIYGIIFFLFLIPGTPKDLITYLAPLLPVKPLKLLVCAVAARLPLMLVSTLAGANLYEGDFLHSAVLFGALLAVGVAGMVVNEIIIKKRNSTAEAADCAAVQ